MAVVRGGAVAAQLVVALALSSSWDAASAQNLLKRKVKQPPQTSKPGNPKRMPPNAKYTTVVANRYHKRDYEITCTTDYGAACYIKCPARCPNKCLAYCAYCLTFCRQYLIYIFAYLHLYIFVNLYIYIFVYLYLYIYSV
jgi:hypothetical protein